MKKNLEQLWFKISLKQFDLTIVLQEQKWSIKEGAEVCTDEEEIANKFNDYFIEKVAKLKDGIDKAKVMEPLDKLKSRMDKKNLKFTLKTVSEKTVEKVMKEMRNKKSAGHDIIYAQILDECYNVKLAYKGVN